MELVISLKRKQNLIKHQPIPPRRHSPIFTQGKVEFIVRTSLKRPASWRLPNFRTIERPYIHPQKSMDKDKIIAQTKKWIVDVVVGLNFCPFAAREVKRNSIAFEVIAGNKTQVLEAFSAAIQKMNAEDETETMFLILPQHFTRFADYLKLVKAAETFIQKEGYEGFYQVASFHPSYVFAGSRATDAANYTNRSPYPMLHILREESVSRATNGHPDTNKIPEVNIAFARQKGWAYMQRLWAACLEV